MLGQGAGTYFHGAVEAIRCEMTEQVESSGKHTKRRVAGSPVHISYGTGAILGNLSSQEWNFTREARRQFRLMARKIRVSPPNRSIPPHSCDEMVKLRP